MVHSIMLSCTFTPSHLFVLLNENTLDNLINRSFDKIKVVLEKWINNGSNWIVDRIVSIKIDVFKD